MHLSESRSFKEDPVMKKRLFTAAAVLCIAAMLASCGRSYESALRRPENKTQSYSDMAETEAESPAGSNAAPAAAKASAEIAAETAPAQSYAAACEYGPADSGYTEEEPYRYELPDLNTEEYNAVRENGFRSVLTSPLSTFAADVDTASYSNVRRMLEWGYTKEEIPAGAVRAEEMINYFSYDYKGPEEGEPFGVNAEIADCPWNKEHKLLMLGLQTEAIDFSEAPDTNLVFLIDVSGSMDEENKLPLLVESFSMLAEELGEKDRVSIVTYASGNERVLEGVNGSRTEKIIKALEGLRAGGYTNGGRGITDAYDLAEEYYIEGGNNRVILATDGDFNVGVTSESELDTLIREEKEKGIFLSVLGFGMGNYSDARMETLADSGDGNYAYIDSLKEAKKVLVEELGANMFTVAKDTKLQIEFNPAYVAEYRQIGYENRAMAAEDFADDTKDGGEVGAGHSITVLYEIVPADRAAEEEPKLKYQNAEVSPDAVDSGEWLTLSIRYKDPDKDRSRLLEYPVGEESYVTDPSEDFVFAGAVAEFAMILGGSEFTGDGSLRHLKKILDEISVEDEYRDGFIDMVYMVR